MNKIFNKIKFLLTKPKVVFIIGEGRKASREAIFQVLKQYFKVGKDVFVFETEDKEINKFIFFLKNSQRPILAITGINKTSLVKNLPANTCLVLNYDNDTVKEIEIPAVSGGVLPERKYPSQFCEKYMFLLHKNFRKIAGFMFSPSASLRGWLHPHRKRWGIQPAKIKNLANANVLTFGFQEGADIRASDVKIDSDTNFKINYQGNIVPVWLAPTPNEDKSPSAAKIDEVSPRYGVGVGKEQIYASLSAVAVGTILGLNLVEISQALGHCQAKVAPDCDALC